MKVMANVLKIFISNECIFRLEMEYNFTFIVVLVIMEAVKHKPGPRRSSGLSCGFYFNPPHHFLICNRNFKLVYHAHS